MYRKVFLLLLGLFLITTSAWAGRCGPPPGNYNAQTDSYIVIEGVISGLPSNYIYARPLFFNPLSTSCTIAQSFAIQTPSHPYYCHYFIFKNTRGQQQCWEYFKNLSSLNLRVLTIRIKRSSVSQEEIWNVNPSSRTVRLGPVQTR